MRRRMALRTAPVALTALFTETAMPRPYWRELEPDADVDFEEPNR
jgi:hypothetical protein